MNLNEIEDSRIDAGQLEMAEVFMPYALIPSKNQTLFQAFTESLNRLLLSK